MEMTSRDTTSEHGWRLHDLVIARSVLAGSIAAAALFLAFTDPGGALAMAKLLGVRPAEVLYLGDTNTDMRTAVAAGMFPVGATWGFRPLRELLDNGAKAIADHPMELLKLL